MTLEAALLSGARRYFTGEPCKNGHIAERRIYDKRCVECLSEKWQRRYAIHAERYIATAKRHYQINPERVKERARRWYYDNNDRARARRKDYYWQNREKLIADVAQWASENPERVRASRTNGKARRRGIDGRISADDIVAMMDRQQGKCVCGASLLEAYTIDHIVALATGGNNFPENVQLLCAYCNSSKGKKPMADWLDRT